MEIVNFDILKINLDTNKKTFDKKPFKYIVLDDFLIQSQAEMLLLEFPKITKEWVDARGLHTQNKWTM